MVVHTARIGEGLSNRKTKLASLVRFPWKISKRNLGATSISEDKHTKSVFTDQTNRSRSDTSFPKRIGRSQSRTLHVSGRAKGDSDHKCNRRHFHNVKCNEVKPHIIRKYRNDTEPRRKIMKFDQLQEVSNTAFSNRGLKRPKSSNVHNSNFRMRLYLELNVVKKPPRRPTYYSTFPCLRSKPIIMNKEQTIDRDTSDKGGKFSIHTGQSMVSDDEEIFALDI